MVRTSRLARRLGLPGSPARGADGAALLGAVAAEPWFAAGEAAPAAVPVAGPGSGGAAVGAAGLRSSACRSRSRGQGGERREPGGRPRQRHRDHRRQRSREEHRAQHDLRRRAAHVREGDLQRQGAVRRRPRRAGQAGHRQDLPDGPRRTRPDGRGERAGRAEGLYGLGLVGRSGRPWPRPRGPVPGSAAHHRPGTHRAPADVRDRRRAAEARRGGARTRATSDAATYGRARGRLRSRRFRCSPA